jgi:hypothetical protein
LFSDDSLQEKSVKVSQEKQRKRSLTFAIDGATFAELIDKRNSRGLGDGWADVIYKGFHSVWPYCALSMKNNYLNRSHAHYSNSFKWSAVGKCRTGRCISVKFIVNEQPIRGADVIVTAEIKGECLHAGDAYGASIDFPNRRYLSGTMRSAVIEELNSSGITANEQHKRSLGKMSSDECKFGNTTNCQTPAVLRQALYENRKKERLHDDVTFELEIQRRAWVASTPGTHVHGFIQSIGLYPFFVLFYLERQLNVYIQCALSSNCILHVDATGSIVSSLGEKTGRDTVYLYSVILAQHNLPVCEFFTTDHRSHAIQAHLDTFNASVAVTNNNQRIRPAYVVTDFSYAIIHAVTKSFNECDLVSYLGKCEQILSGRSNTNHINSTCFVVLCVAHIIKALSRRLCKVQPDSRQRQAILVWFTSLQRCTKMSTAVDTYLDIHCALCSRHDDEVVCSARERLTALATGQVMPECLNSTDTEFDDDFGDTDTLLGDDYNINIVSDGTLRNRSPFTTIFAVKSLNCDDGTPVTNSTYSPASFKVIQDIIHLFPLWSCALQTQPNRLANDVIKSFDNAIPCCLSNSIVESHFKSIKHGRLGHRTRVRPRLFLELELSYINGKLNELLLPQTPKRRRKLAVDSDCASEKWKKRKPAKYSSRSSAANILKTLSSPAKAKKLFKDETRNACNTDSMQRR